MGESENTENRKPEEILAYVKRSFAEASAGGASFLEHLLGSYGNSMMMLQKPSPI